MKTTGGNRSGQSEITMEDVQNLVKKKDEIEEQIKAYYDVLEDVSLADNQLANSQANPNSWGNIS